MAINSKRTPVFILVSVLMLAVVGGCASDGPSSLSSSQNNKEAIISDARVLADAGVQKMQTRDFAGASRDFNKALKLDITDSAIQFLNGLAYHLQAVKGDVSYFPLAQQGYQLAIQFDSSNWLAYYYAGLLKQDQRDFVAAQDYFAEALLYRENDPDILYSLGASSYYAQDPETAGAAFERLLNLEPQNARALQASSVVLAALGNEREAFSHAARYNELTSDAGRTESLHRRIRAWNKVHERAKGSDGKVSQSLTQFAQMNDMNDGMNMGGEEGNSNDEEGIESEEDPYKMVIVDVVIIRTEEDITSSKGVNLLNGLTLQFGSEGLSTAGVSIQRTREEQDGGPGISRTITRALNIPSINYSLNIANTGSARNEILARPTLVALAGEQSEFFSGVEVEAAAVGGSNSDGATVSVQKEIGVKLALQPEFLDDGRIKLNVAAERTFLTTPNTSSITFDLRIDTSKTMVNANVAMNFGESLILSGLSEKETERGRDGVPFLQDIPIVQYLFSNRTTRDFQKSVLILLTPRPPSYTYQSGSQKKQSQRRMSKNERTLSELQARYSDWFKPYPNWASVFHHMQDNTLYREFRTGDVTMERWANMETLSSRLRQALEFLYY